MSFLSHILEIVFPSRDAEALVRSASFASLAPFVMPSAFEAQGTSITSLLPYRTAIVKACVREAKFHGSTKAWQLLGEVLAEYVREFMCEHEGFGRPEIILVPIPLSKKRRKERGYNQAECIVRETLRHLEGMARMDAGIIERSRDTAPQTSLRKAARKENMQGAFGALHRANPSHTYIIVDDVTTTGATLLTAADALAAAGAVSILPLALAH